MIKLGCVKLYDNYSDTYLTTTVSNIERKVHEINYYAWRFRTWKRYADRVNELRYEIGLPALPENVYNLCKKPNGSFLEVRYELAITSDGGYCVVLDWCLI
jgi:hypothetical protein